VLIIARICTTKFAHIKRRALNYKPFYRESLIVDGIKTESVSAERIIDGRLVVGQDWQETTTFGHSFSLGELSL
jgi:hypothetical protein